MQRSQQTGPQPSYIMGLDLGQSKDYTALAVLEIPVPKVVNNVVEAPVYSVRHLKRWDLGTNYPAIVADVHQLAMGEPFQGRAAIAVDQTGVGRAVVDLLRVAQVPGLVPILITAGHAITVGDDGACHVPKKELVSVLQVLLQKRRLKVASSLQHAETLTKELANFKVKITAAANETFEAWREGDHDDLVLAVAMAGWLAERDGVFEAPSAIHVGRKNIWQRIEEGERPRRRLFGR